MAKPKVKACHDLHTTSYAVALRQMRHWKRTGNGPDPPPSSYGHFKVGDERAYLVDATDKRGGARLYLIVYEQPSEQGQTA